MPFNISEGVLSSLPDGFFRFSPFIRRLFPGSVSGGHRGQEPFPNGNAPACRRLADTAAGSPADRQSTARFFHQEFLFPRERKTAVGATAVSSYSRYAPKSIGAALSAGLSFRKARSALSEISASNGLIVHQIAGISRKNNFPCFEDIRAIRGGKRLVCVLLNEQNRGA